MTIDVTSDFEIQEAAVVSKPRSFIALFRTENDTVLSGGSHNNTQLISGELSLVSPTTGDWVSPAIDSGFLTGFNIYDKLSWVGSGEIAIKSSQTEAGLADAPWAYRYNDEVQNEIAFRWYQLKAELSGSEVVSDLKARYKAVVNPNEYSSISEILSGPGVDFHNVPAGTCRVSFDNRSQQWEKRYSNSYIYNKNVHGQFLEVWAGYEIGSVLMGMSHDMVLYDPDGEIENADVGEFSRTEWLLQFIGVVDSLETATGSEGGTLDAAVGAKDFIYSELQQRRIGEPASDGTPQPYCQGRRYREPLKEIDEVSFIYKIYCASYPLSAVNNVYIRESETNKWTVLNPANYSANTANGQITATAKQTSETVADVTYSSLVHPVDIILDILQSVLDAEYINTASFTAAKAVFPNLEVGVNFDNIEVLAAIEELLPACDCALYVENGQVVIQAYSRSLPVATQHYTMSKHTRVVSKQTTDYLCNRYSVPYGDYEDDPTKMIDEQDATSIATYGEIQNTDLSFTYSDPVSFNSATYLQSVIQQILERVDDLIEILTIDTDLSILRTEVYDVVDLTDTIKVLSEDEVLVLTKRVDLSQKGGTLTTILYERAT